MEKMTSAQRKIIDDKFQKQIVSAGAGSGKTKSLVIQFAEAIQEGSLSIDNIVSITFTEKAANELKDKIRKHIYPAEAGDKEIAKNIELAYISTIHSFCARLLRKYAVYAGLDPRFTVLDEKQSEILKIDSFNRALFDFMKNASSEKVDFAISYDLDKLSGDFQKTIMSIYDDIRCRGNINPEFPDLVEKNYSSEDIVDVYRAYLFIKELFELFVRKYQKLKDDGSYLDFEDLQLMTCELLEKNQEIRDKLHKQFELIQVDEFQDTNRLQLKLVNLINPKYLCLVGDKNQSIYRFRHADVRIFDDKIESFSRGKEVINLLSENFRSEQGVISFINCLFSCDNFFGNKFQKLKYPFEVNKKNGGSVEILAIDRSKRDRNYSDSVDNVRKQEASLVAKKIKKSIDNGQAPGEIAILLRAVKGISKYFEKALAAKGVPYYVQTGEGYYETLEMKDIKSYLSIVANPLDDINLIAVLKSPFVRLSDEGLFLLSVLKKEQNLSSYFEAVTELIKTDFKVNSLDGSFSEKDKSYISEFISSYNKISDFYSSNSISSTIEKIIYETKYDLSMLHVPTKNSIFANIRKLIRIAKDYELIYGNNLRDFILELDGFKDISYKEGNAPLEKEKGNAVRIMSVHAAKGLEFDIVFVADCSRSFGSGDNKRPLVSYIPNDKNADKGFGFIYKDYKKPNITGKDSYAFATEENFNLNRNYDIEEGKRIFYVAVTRARKRLIISGGFRSDKSLGSDNSIMKNVLAGTDNFNNDAIFKSEIVDFDNRPDAFEFNRVSHKTSFDKEPLLDFKKIPKLTQIFHPPKVPVRRLSFTAINNYITDPYKFFTENLLGVRSVLKPTTYNGVSSADYGILVHKKLAEIDWKNTQKDELPEINNLIKSNVGEWLRNAEKVEAEVPFAYEVSLMLIEGKFDALVNDNTIIDFKTTQKRDLTSFSNNYDLQMKIYALALLKKGAESVKTLLIFLSDLEKPVEKGFSIDEVPDIENEIKCLIEEIYGIYNKKINLPNNFVDKIIKAAYV